MIGIDIYLHSDNKVELRPINSKGQASDSAILIIPGEEIPHLIDALQRIEHGDPLDGSSSMI